MLSRFAVKEDIFSDAFSKVNEELLELNASLNLVDHTELNRRRFNWFNDNFRKPVFYGSRFWEYPFAILAADIKAGMKCADIGCGTTPFTAYLCRKAGADHVSGYDPDPLTDESETHYAFGTRNDFVKNLGFHFYADDMTQLSAPDESFDRVFCISVIEHIERAETWQRGIKEMARVLKPGGRLIVTVDLGIDCPLTHPLELIRYSGLAPLAEIDWRWPVERFVNYNGAGMDVFGLVLEKAVQPVFLDTENKSTIPKFEAYKRFTPGIMSASASQMANDYQRRYGAFRVITKLLLGRYS